MSPVSSRRSIHFERSYRAPIEEVWSLWTTKDGFEAWWGPEGFTTKVLTLDLREGGELRYQMSASGHDEIEFMKKAKLPLTTEVRGRFAEVQPMRHLIVTQLLDFIPGVAPYEVAARVDFVEKGGNVQMTLDIDANHDDAWTERSTMGWESQLRKLGKRFEA